MICAHSIQIVMEQENIMQKKPYNWLNLNKTLVYMDKNN